MIGHDRNEAAEQEAAEERPDDLNLRAIRDKAERGAVVTALARTNGNIVKASELLGITRPTLYDLMNRLAIRGDRNGEAKGPQ